MKTQILNLLCCCALVLAACGAGSASDRAARNGSNFAEADARRVNVFSRIGGQERPLPPGQPIQLRVGDSLRVDEGGYAILRFFDLVTVEVLRQGNLQVRELSRDEQSPLVAFGQSAGTFANELKPGANGVTRRLEIQSNFATITATGTRFVIARELGTPLEWLWAIEANEEDLTVSAAGETRSATSGTAYWMAPIGPPSQAIEFDPVLVSGWLDGLREGRVQAEVGDAFWQAADTILAAGDLTGDILPGGKGALGDIPVALAADGVRGPASYSRSDCNQDGILDLAMTDGKVSFDLRAVGGRVRAVDMTVTKEDGQFAEDLQVFNPAYEKLNYGRTVVQRSNDTVLSVRSHADRGQQPFHYAALSLTDGCFLGISLTPPLADGTAAAPRPAIPEALCTVTAAGLNLRRGPDISFTPPIRLLRRDDQLIPLGRTANSGWIQVQVKDDGREGWVSANPQFVGCAIPVAALPVLAAPDTPEKQPEQTPTPVSQPSEARHWQSPQLLTPPDGASFDAGSAVGLRWSAAPVQSHTRGPGVARRLLRPSNAEDTLLRDDEYYQVTIRFSPAIESEWSDVHLVKEDSFVVPAYLNSREMTWDQRYSWSIVVVQRPSVGGLKLLSPESESRVFYWRLRPEDAPTPIPTRSPTPFPTDTPTATPTDTPTAVPTDTPTAIPTDTPTAIPTDTPTAIPTDTPTAVPTDTPTAVPTATSTPIP